MNDEPTKTKRTRSKNSTKDIIKGNINPDYEIPAKAAETHMFYHVKYYKQAAKGSKPEEHSMMLPYCNMQALMSGQDVFERYLHAKYGEGAEIELVHKP